MNKTELIDRVARTTRQTKSSVEATLNAALDIIKDSVTNEEDVTLVGFGTFTRSHRQARPGRHPHSGEEILIPEMVLPRFKPGKDFKERLEREASRHH